MAAVVQLLRVRFSQVIKGKGKKHTKGLEKPDAHNRHKLGDALKDVLGKKLSERQASLVHGIHRSRLQRHLAAARLGRTQSMEPRITFKCVIV